LRLGDEHWAEFRGETNDQAPKPLTRATLAKLISAFGLRTRTIWPRNRTPDSKSWRAVTAGHSSRRLGPTIATRATHQHILAISCGCSVHRPTPRPTRLAHCSVSRLRVSYLGDAEAHEAAALLLELDS
jgi:hypothetical protein